jgi:hypothetical protein
LKFQQYTIILVRLFKNEKKRLGTKYFVYIFNTPSELV